MILRRPPEWWKGRIGYIEVERRVEGRFGGLERDPRGKEDRI